MRVLCAGRGAASGKTCSGSLANGRSTDTQMIDSTHVKAHRSAAGGKGERKQAVGRSRGGRNRKNFTHIRSDGFTVANEALCDRANRALRLRWRKAPFSICECPELSMTICASRNLAVEQLIAQARIEALYVAVLPGTAPLDLGGVGTDNRDPFLTGPLSERHAG